MTATLIELVGDTELLRDLAGPRSYERGENYAAGGYVHSITEYKGKLVATVTGTHDYQVKLWVERDSLESDCTCPMGEMGEYRFIFANGVRIGGVMRKPAPIPVSMWNFYIGVEDIDRAAEAVSAGGGQIMHGPTEIPGGEYTVSGTDPQGAYFGLVGPRKS